MKIRFEFLQTETAPAEAEIVDADRFEQTNGWVIALKGETVVFAENEKHI